MSTVLWILGGLVVALGLFVLIARLVRVVTSPSPNPAPKLAHVTPLDLTPAQIAKFPAFPKIAHKLLEIDPDDGWPPKLSAAIDPKPVAPHPPLTQLDSQREDRLRHTALRDPRVREHLHGRWELFGVHHIEQRNYRHGGPLHTRLSFYSYTARHAIDVTMHDDEIVAVEKRAGYLQPESPGEIKQAIAMASADERICDGIKGLDAHAILQSPADPKHSLSGHRTLWVVFSEPDVPTTEMAAKFTALVDLSEQKVVWAGPAPCKGA
jgi:hypothetical protein